MKKPIIILLLFVNGVGYYSHYLASNLHFYFYDAMQEAFTLSHVQIGVYSSIYGVVAMCGYIFGGMVADAVKTKYLLVSSYAMNMIVYVFFATMPPYKTLLILQFATSLIAYGLFWGAMVKFVRSMGSAENESKLFGLQFAFIGVGGSVLGMLGASFVGKFGSSAGLSYLFTVSAVTCFLAMIVTAVFYKPQETKVDESDKFKFSYILEIMRLKQFWAICLMSFCMYSMSLILSYLPPLLTSKYAVSIGIVSMIGTFRVFILRIILAPIGGAIMDKVGSPIKVICTALVVTTALGLLLILGPDNVIAIPFIVIIGMAICYQITTPGWFTPVSEIKIPEKMKGTAIGILSAIMFAPDAFAYTVIGGWIDNYGDKGYTMGFTTVTAVMLIGFFCGLYALRCMKKQKLAQQADI